ncbi:MAG: hypothetical protein U0Q22_00585 [Acidimicrobiales bacterium]
MLGAQPWRDDDRRRFRAAQAALGHTQAECAEQLRALGAPSADQSSVSKWATGRIARPSPAIVNALHQYIALAPAGGGASTSRGSRAAHMQSDGLEADGFEDMVRGITDEPLLGPRQGDLVDALIERMRSGIPLSEPDLLVLGSLASVLGLTMNVAAAPSPVTAAL